MTDIKQYLKELTGLNAASSREDAVIQYMCSHLAKFTDNIEVDTLGNIICRFSGDKPNPKRIMMFAHMDEIGFVVRKMEANGFLRVERVGGTNMNVVPGSRVDVLGDTTVIQGVVGSKSYHFLQAHERGTIPSIDQLYIDIGASSKEEAEAIGVHVGSFVTFHSEFIEMYGDLVANKSMDNRIGCSILLKTAEQLSECSRSLEWDVYLVACVQEEFNIRGIIPAVRQIDPHVSIGIDVTPSCDTPDLNGFSDVVINKGPALTFLNYHGRGTLAGTLPDESLIRAIVEVAEQKGIPYQREIAVGVITENAFLLFENQGISVANVSIPTRYTHSPVEVVSLKDIRLAIDLILSFLMSLRQDTLFGKSRFTPKPTDRVGL